MSYDIYGNTLRRGFCEVHPHVGEEYPCSVCCVERDRDHERQRLAEEQRDQYYAGLAAQEAGDAEFESWFPSGNSK